MDLHSSGSRNSSRYSKSVVLPRIKSDRGSRNSHDSAGIDLGHTSSRMKEQDDQFKYILERLDYTEKTLEAERRDRNVLEDHVRGLMSNLQRLSKDMAMLQQQLKSGETNAHSQSVALKNLELHQVSGIGDVWNRLTLGDLNTIKLSGDLNTLSGEVSDLKRYLEHFKQNLEKLTKDVESKLDKSSSELDKKFQVLKAELDLKITGFEQNLQIAEKRNERLDGCKSSNHEMEEHYLQVVKNFELRFDQFMEKNDQWKENLEKKLSLLEEELFKVKGTASKNYEDLASRLNDLKANQKKASEKSHEAVKEQYREAFRAVYESITTMQTVLEAKLKMTEADLKTSINSILRTISK